MWAAAGRTAAVVISGNRVSRIDGAAIVSAAAVGRNWVQDADLDRRDEVSIPESEAGNP